MITTFKGFVACRWPAGIAQLGPAAFRLVSSMWNLILDHMLSLLVVIVTPVLLSMLAKFLKSRNIPIQQDVMEKVVKDAIHYAEGAGHDALRKGAPMEGHEKLEKALTYVDTETKRLGLDVAASDALEKLVEANLAKLKLGGELPPSEKPADPVPGPDAAAADPAPATDSKDQT